MNFWLRNSILAIILIALAYLLLENQELLFSLGGQGDDEQTSVVTSAADQGVNNTAEVKRPSKRKKSTNAAADGLSRFYASINPTMDGKGPRVKNNVVYLPDPDPLIKLTALLEARRMVVRPYRKNWQGSTESRPFRKGQTLFQKLTDYAESDGLEVIWWLNRDFIIKDPFRIEKNILDTAYQIGSAVEGHFINGLSTYFCYRHRALVLIEESNEYLNDECILLTSKQKY